MVNVIGLGYIGLPTALMMAAHGVDVVGSDYNTDLVKTLQSGKTTFKEKGLGELFSQAVSNGITFSDEYQVCDTYIVSVPTPYIKETKRVDAQYVVSAIRSVIKVAPRGAVVVIESTISPGTIDRYVRPVLESEGCIVGKDLHLAHAPERIIPGNMLHELIHNNRTIGVDCAEVGERVKQLYESFCRGVISITDIRTAEMTKVVENTFRDVNIAFANELQKICQFDGLDVHEIIRIANQHPRVNILAPGPGVGGHCISVDPWFLVGDYPEQTRLIRAAREINDGMPEYVLKRTREIMQERGIDSPNKVGIYGLTYKENVDDVRESPTLQMLDSMDFHLGGGVCKVYDPWVQSDIAPQQVHSLSEFLDGTEMIIVMVGHSQLDEDRKQFGSRVLLDTRNVLGVGSNIYKL